MPDSGARLDYTVRCSCYFVYFLNVTSSKSHLIQKDEVPAPSGGINQTSWSLINVYNRQTMLENSTVGGKKTFGILRFLLQNPKDIQSL